MTGLSKPMLKPDVRSATVASGVYVSHHNDGFVIGNTQAAAVVARLLGLLDGRRSADMLEAALPEKVRPLFGSLLRSLMENGMLVEGPRGLLPPEAYTTPLAAMAQTLSSDWEQQLRDLRESSPLVRGSKVAVDHAVALLEEREIPATSEVEDGTHGLSIEPADLAKAVIHGLFLGGRFVFGCLERASIADWHSDAIASLGNPEQPTLLMERLGAAVACHEVILAYLRENTIDKPKTKAVRPNGTVVDYDLNAARFVDPTQQRVKSQWTAEQASLPSWLDPNGAIHRGQDIEPAFPLAHSELVISDGSDLSTTVIEWGTSPQHADARALARACEELAARRHGGKSCDYHAAEPDDPEVAAWDDIASLSTAETADYPLSEDSYLGEMSGLLARLALIHWGALPKVRVSTSQGAALVRCELLDVHASGLGIDVDTALTQALGSALSMLQTGRVPTGEQQFRELLSGRRNSARQTIAEEFPGGLRVFAT